jgi:hypothetical protein
VSNEEHRLRIQQLHELVLASSVSSEWSSATAPDGAPEGWQRAVLTRLLALTMDQDIAYIASAKLDDQDWDFIAFTESRVVRVLVTLSGKGDARLETTTFPRHSLESLELLDVGPVPENEEDWPVDLTMIGHYRSASIPLPLDKFSSTTNKRELARLLRSLLQDVGH